MYKYITQNKNNILNNKGNYSCQCNAKTSPHLIKIPNLILLVGGIGHPMHISFGRFKNLEFEF